MFLLDTAEKILIVTLLVICMLSVGMKTGLDLRSLLATKGLPGAASCLQPHGAGGYAFYGLLCRPAKLQARKAA